METIRVTTMDQLKACFAVRFKVFVEEQQVPEHVEMDEKDESPEACHHFLIVRWRSQPIAHPDGMNTKSNSQIAACSCLKGYRGRSLGKQLILAMEQQARRDRLHNMRFSMHNAKQRAFTANWAIKSSRMSLFMMLAFYMSE